MARSAGVSGTQRPAVPARRAAQRADLFLAEVVALAAALHAGERIGERVRQLLGAAALVLEVKRHAARRARPDPGQHAQSLDEPLEPFAVGTGGFVKTAA